MYLPSHFEEKRVDVLQHAVRAHPFGLLITQSAAGTPAVPCADAIPFLLDAAPESSPGLGTAFGTLRAHVARANPLWREARTDVDSLVVFQGPQAYVSPGWYAAKAEHGKVVPTWNYILVQASGRLRVVDDAAWLHALVTRLTDRHEAALPTPWAVADAPGDYVDGMLRAIVGIEIEITSLVGKWKLSQNRSAADRAGVVAGLRVEGDEAMAAQVAAPGGTA